MIKVVEKIHGDKYVDTEGVLRSKIAPPLKH
jgi:hypothetical protein